MRSGLSVPRFCARSSRVNSSFSRPSAAATPWSGVIVLGIVIPFGLGSVLRSVWAPWGARVSAADHSTPGDRSGLGDGPGIGDAGGMADGGGIGDAGGMTERAGGIGVGVVGSVAAMAGLLEIGGRSVYHPFMNSSSGN